MKSTMRVGGYSLLYFARWLQLSIRSAYTKKVRYLYSSSAPAWPVGMAIFDFLYIAFFLTIGEPIEIASIRNFSKPFKPARKIF